LLFECACGQTPFGKADADDMAILKRISAHSPGSLVLPETTSPALEGLLSGLLHPDVKLRLGTPGGDAEAHSVLGHTYFADVNWAALAEGELPSPLQTEARTQLATRIAEGARTRLQPHTAPIAPAPPSRPPAAPRSSTPFTSRRLPGQAPTSRTGTTSSPPPTRTSRGWRASQARCTCAGFDDFRVSCARATSADRTAVCDFCCTCHMYFLCPVGTRCTLYVEYTYAVLLNNVCAGLP